jgi:hypothetical protein
MRGICREHGMEARRMILRVLPLSDESEGQRKV